MVGILYQLGSLQHQNSWIVPKDKKSRSQLWAPDIAEIEINPKSMPPQNHPHSPQQWPPEQEGGRAHPDRPPSPSQPSQQHCRILDPRLADVPDIRS